MYREQIEKYIEEHRQELIDDVIRMCRIDSQKGPKKVGMPFGEGPYKSLMDTMEMAKGYGFDVINYDNYVLAIDLNDKEKQLDILAHLDVVPEGEGWTVCKPFEPVVQDGKIFGRGTSDDKGPVVASMLAMRCVRDLKIPLSRNARLILGTDEECGGACIDHYYKSETEAPMSFSPDGEYPVVNIEKGRLPGHFSASFEKENTKKRLVSLQAGTKLNVVPPKAKAVLEGFAYEEVRAVADRVEEKTGIAFTFDLQPVFEITAHGVNAHGSLPAHGKNAITGLLALLTELDFEACAKIDLLHKLNALMPHGDLNGENLGVKISDELSGETTLAFSMLNVNDTEYEGFFDSRYPISGEPEFIISTISKKFADAGFEFLNKDMVAPHAVDGNSHFVQTLLRIYEEYTGLKGECLAIGGGTYVHDLKNGVAFGAVLPGTDTKMHGADEFAVIEELVVTAKIIAQSIVDLCA